MPVGTHKNAWYALALPVLGKRCQWKQVAVQNASGNNLTSSMTRVLRRHHTVGGCVQLLRNGQLAENYTAGYASLSPGTAVTPETVFRTASIAKLACAMLVMRLQTLGFVHVEEDISALWGKPIRTPHYPDQPIPLASLLSHTSGLVDSPAYFRAFRENTPASELLANPEAFANRKAFERFQYSNFAAGLIGCLLEHRFQASLESLMQKYLFQPLSVDATFDLSTLVGRRIANSYRVLPASRIPDFDAVARFRIASPLDSPDPEHHYLLASGNLYLSSPALAQLCLPLMNGGMAADETFLNPSTLEMMTTPLTAWPEPEVRMRHAMGVLEVDDRQVHPHRLWGHQGFAYGAVNGVFWDAQGNGFVSLNAGASEQRMGHLSSLNRDLIALCIPEASHE